MSEMASCTFVFDIVVTHIGLTSVESVDPKEIQVEATINYRTVSITASRINVTEFKDNCSTELTVTPANLRQTLEECGVPVLVKYSGEILGTGMLSFPGYVTESISENMEPLMHVDTCRLERDGQNIGTLEVLCRLFTKCTDQPKSEESSCRRDMEKSINKEDILFIVSDSQRCPADCDPCLDAVDPGEGDDYLRLGTQSVRTTAPKFVDTLIYNPVGDSVCREIKNMADDCDQILNSIFCRSDHPKPLKPPCRKPADFYNPCIRHVRESEECFRTTPCFSYLPAQQVESRDVGKMVQVPLPIDDMKRDNRFCHVCLANMSFLPKFAACPNCGIKPMPIIEQRPKPKKLTADQILMEYLGKPTDDDNSVKKSAKEMQETECHCTCKLGKLCAYCRVLEKCSNFYHKIGNKMPKVLENNMESEGECSVSVEEKVSRQFLAQVFSELCDLQNITGIRRASEVERECHQKSPQKKKRQKGGQAYTAHKNVRTSLLDCARSDAGFTLKKSDHFQRLSSGAHKDCGSTVGRVPRRHGWNWSVSPEARKYGWRPGAIRKPILKLMKFFLHYSPAEKAFNKCKTEEAELKKTGQLPTLNLCKKNGEIFITLRTINNNPNVRMEPIVFKVVKSDLAVALSEIKRKLKEKGFPKCTCHKTVMMCVCRDILAKKHLEYALSKECKRRGMENCVDHLVLTDTSDSEMEFDFDVSPPAALATPLKEHTTTNGTQTDEKDLNVPPKYPVPLNPYWRAYDCAAGDRYTGTAFGAPGEAVFEDGIFGYGGGGPHGESAAPGGKTKAAGVWGVSPGGPMRGGGRTGPGGIGVGAGDGLRGKSFPGAKKPRTDPSPAIPVRMRKRHIEAVKRAAQAKKDAVKDEIERRKKGIDTMRYLMKKGTVPEPWDPNNPKPKGQPKPAPVLGPDGLTDAQRRRRALYEMCIPPLDSMPRLGGGHRCCCAECCYPYCYYC